jgi:hypothetical protein
MDTGDGYEGGKVSGEIRKSLITSVSYLNPEEIDARTKENQKDI